MGTAGPVGVGRNGANTHEATMTRYWMVHGVGVPNVRHATEHDARAEAERLARVNRGQTLVVLEAIARVTASDVKWEPLEYETPTTRHNAPF